MTLRPTPTGRIFVVSGLRRRQKMAGQRSLYLNCFLNCLERSIPTFQQKWTGATWAWLRLQMAKQEPSSLGYTIIRWQSLCYSLQERKLLYNIMPPSVHFSGFHLGHDEETSGFSSHQGEVQGQVDSVWIPKPNTLSGHGQQHRHIH